MTRIRRAGAAALAAAAALLAACADPVDILRPDDSEEGRLFRSYVALGNSITMGWQSGGISDSTQRRSYAHLFAQQLYGDDVDARFAYPSFADPGCPPPLVNFATGERTHGATTTPCFLRDVEQVGPVLNNVAWYDAWSADPFNLTPVRPQIPPVVLATGGMTQVARALQADPTFATVWIGNNDVLIPAMSGILGPLPGQHPGMTSEADFAANIERTVDDLVAGAPGLEGALFAVANVVHVPALIPAAAFLNPQFRAGVEQAIGGRTLTVLSNCTPTTASRINFPSLILAIRAGQHPAVIGCERNSVPGTAVGDVYVLDAAEQATVAARVQAFNAAIEAKADELEWAFVDINPAFVALRQSGAIPQVPNLASATALFGTIFSLDGTHPGNAGHVLIANALIEAVNAHYQTDIAPLPVP